MQTQEYGVAGLVDGLKDKARQIQIQIHMGQNSDRAKQTDPETEEPRQKGQDYTETSWQIQTGWLRQRQRQHCKSRKRQRQTGRSRQISRQPDQSRHGDGQGGEDTDRAKQPGPKK